MLFCCFKDIAYISSRTSLKVTATPVVKVLKSYVSSRTYGVVARADEQDGRQALFYEAPWSQSIHGFEQRAWTYYYCVRVRSLVSTSIILTLGPHVPGLCF